MDSGITTRRRVCFCLWQGWNLVCGAGCGFGGAETVIWRAAKAIARDERIEVQLATFTTEFEGERSIDGVGVIGVRPSKALAPGDGRLRRALTIALHAVGVLKRLVRLNADVYFANLAGHESVVAYFAARLRGSAFVYRIAHDWETNEAELRANILRGRRWLTRAMVYCISHADAVIAQTREQQTRLKENYGVNAQVIHNPHTIPEDPAAGERDCGVLWIARVHPMKRPMEFLELARALPAVRFRMILAPAGGQEALFDSILSVAATLPNVDLTPGLPATQATAQYQRSCVTVLTSEAEGLSNVLIESLKAATPVISFHHNPDGILAPVSSGELLPAGGYCVAGERAKAVEIIRRLVSDSSFWSDCSRRAFELAKENFDAEQIIPMYQELLMTVMRRRS